MTYKQIKKSVRDLLESHAMITEVRSTSPLEWIKKPNQPEYPVCCFTIDTGAFTPGEKSFNVQMWFLDCSGPDGLNEDDVVSDQVEIANDIVALLLKESNAWRIDEDISFNVISENFEDFLSGCSITVNIKTDNDYDTCVIPFTV